MRPTAAGEGDRSRSVPERAPCTGGRLTPAVSTAESGLWRSRPQAQPSTTARPATVRTNYIHPTLTPGGPINGVRSDVRTTVTARKIGASRDIEPDVNPETMDDIAKMYFVLSR